MSLTGNPGVDRIIDRVNQSEVVTLDTEVDRAVQQIKDFVAHIYELEISDFDKKGKLPNKQNGAKQLVAYLIYKYITQEYPDIAKYSNFAESTVSTYLIRWYHAHHQTYHLAILEAIDTKIKKADK